MKFRLLFTLLSLITVLVGCKLDGESSHTPQISIATYPRLQNGDSLNIYSTTRNDEILMDTIQLGDTVSLVLHMFSYSNSLTEFYLKQSADSSARIILPSTASLDSLFTTNSEYAKGVFILSPGFNRLLFPFKYVATKANIQTKLTMTIVSDAKFDNMSIGKNSSFFHLLTPIKPKVSTDLEK